MNFSANHKWKRTAQGGMYRNTDRWIVKYPPYMIRGTKGHTYTAKGTAQYRTREEARKFVNLLREKYGLCGQGFRHYITQLPLPDDMPWHEKKKKA